MGSQDARPTVRVAADSVHQLMFDLLCAAGCSEENARAAAASHFDADLRGVGLQGLDYMPYLFKSIESGHIDPKGSPKVIKRTSATSLIDGHRSLGQTAALLAIEEVSRLANEAGMGAVGITNSADIFMLGFYAERLAREKRLVSLIFSAGPPLVHPYGGVERMLSTNPIAFGFPRPDGKSMVFDMGTSALTNARIRQAAYHGESVPLGTGVDHEGRPTTDPSEIQAGAIGPLAEHKGFGLALCVAMLAGPLTGSGIGPQLKGWLSGEACAGMGHFFIAIDPAAFGEAIDFEQAAEAYIQQIKGSKRAVNVDEIRIPGEQVDAIRDRARADGVEVLAATWTIIGELATTYGVTLPATLS